PSVNPLVGTAQTQSTFTDDFDAQPRGTAWDIGAYQHVEPSPTPTSTATATAAPTSTATATATATFTPTPTATFTPTPTATATFTPTPTAPAVTLTVTIKTQGNNRKAQLSWSPTGSGQVNILRNSVIVSTTSDDGKATDNLGSATGTFVYQVCKIGSVCSN